MAAKKTRPAKKAAPKAKKTAKPAPASAEPAGELVDMPEAIKLLKTTRPTFYRWLRSGQIKGHKLGRQWRFYKADLERFLKGQPPRVELPASIEPLIQTLRARCKEAGVKTVNGKGGDPVARAVNLMILLASASRASDIHLTTNMPVRSSENVMVVRNRIDGVLHTVVEVDIRLLPAIVARWKAMAACDVNEKRLPQDGRIIVRLGELGAEGNPKLLDLRVCFLPAAMGENVTVRILDRDVVRLELDKLQFAPRDRDELLKAIRQPWGLIVVTGPTGCGKTTTIYSCLNEVSRPEIKVLTVEDPVEYVLPWATQMGVHGGIGLTFGRCLRAILRSDPDVIFVGEIRDHDTLMVTLQSALTGHLVMTTLHTNDAGSALRRMFEIAKEHAFIIADATKLVMSQRLVRRLCPDCSRKAEPDRHLLSMAQEAARRGGVDPASQPADFREPVGCEQCVHTGYRGRTIISEVMPVTPEIAQAVRREATTEEFQLIAVGQGMTTMAADAYRRAARGETSLREAVRLLG